MSSGGYHQIVDFVKKQMADHFTLPTCDPSKFVPFWRSRSPFSQWHPCVFECKKPILNLVVFGDRNDAKDGKRANPDDTALGSADPGLDNLGSADPRSPRSNIIQFTSTEQYMMYEKAVLFGDTACAKEILLETRPHAVKKLGRKVRGFDQKIWEANRCQIVYEGNLLKFRQNPKLKRALLETKDRIIVEASPYDRIWGVGLSSSDPRIYHPKKWRGKNLLGECLMCVREQLLREDREAELHGRSLIDRRIA